MPTVNDLPPTDLDRTEFLGMIKGEMYSAGDPYVQVVAKMQGKKSRAINAEQDDEKRQQLLMDFYNVKPDTNFYVVAPTFVEYGFNVSIGTDSGIGPNCTLSDVSPITIGDRVLIACNVSLITATHPISPEERQGSKGKEYSKAIVIEDDVWIGANVLVLPGITIGKGSTVGAGSVVTKNVPPRSVVVDSDFRLLDLHTGLRPTHLPSDGIMMSRPAQRLFPLVLSLFSILCFTTTLTHAAPSPPNLVYPLQDQRPPVARLNSTWSWTILADTFNSSSGTTLTLSSRALPAWASFDATTYTFSGMPLDGDEGSTVVQLMANASGVAVGTASSFTLLVVDEAPPYVRLSLASQLPTASSFGDGATYTATGALRVPPAWSFSLGFQQYTFEDPTRSRIYYTAYTTDTTELPSWLNFDNRTVTFDGVAPRTLGEVSITVFGSDRYGYGDLKETIKLSIGYHTLELVGTLPPINATQGGEVNYRIPFDNLRIDNTTVTRANFTDLEVTLGNTSSYLSFNRSSRTISGRIPATLTPGSVALPIKFTDQYNDTLITNVTMAVSSAPLSSSAGSSVRSSTAGAGSAAPTSSTSPSSNDGGGLSRSAKLAIGLTLGLIGGLILLILLIMCCRRRNSTERKMQRDRSVLLFDQATIAAAQRHKFDSPSTAKSTPEKSTKSAGKMTLAARFGMEDPTAAQRSSKDMKEVHNEKSFFDDENTEKMAAAGAVGAGAGGAAAIASSSSAGQSSNKPVKPTRLNVMNMFRSRSGQMKKDATSISLPLQQSQNSIFGLGINDTQPSRHKIVVVADGAGGTYAARGNTPLPYAVDDSMAHGESDLDRSSSFDSRDSSSLFYSEREGSDAEARRPRRTPPQQTPLAPVQRRDFLPLPTHSTSQPPSPTSPTHFNRPETPGSFMSSSGSSSQPSPGIRIINSHSMETSSSASNPNFLYSSSPTRGGDHQHNSDYSHASESESQESIPPRLIPFTNVRTVSQTSADIYRRPSQTAEQESHRNSAHEDAFEDDELFGPGGERPRSGVYLPPEHEGSPTTSAVFYTTPRDTQDEWGMRSPSVSEYDAGEGVRLVGSVVGSPNVTSWDSRHLSPNMPMFQTYGGVRDEEDEDDGELRVIAY